MSNAENYTFESFILDLESNYCAPKMCIAACDQPMTAFPLILYGANGCGKTHLLLAMRNYVEGKTNSKTKIVNYLSCKDLIDDLVYCLDQNGNSDEFYKKYLSYDVLLIDNCHYLAGRKATQEEILRFVEQFYMQGKTLALVFDGAIENYDYIISKIEANYLNFALVKIGMPSDALKTAYIKILCNKMDVTFSDELIDDFLKQSDMTTLPRIRGAMNKLEFELNQNGA